MRLVRGAPGSGKTALVFKEFKAALQTGRTDIRIVVPTATLVRHYQHELARAGVVFSPNAVISLNRFIRERAQGIEPVPEGLLTAITRDCLRRIRVPEFQEIATTEGMVATVLETIALFENAACTPDKLTPLLRKLQPQAKAFEKLWRAIDEAIRATGFASRADMICAASRAITPARKPTIWLDGFLAFSPLEADLIRALAKTSDLTLTLTESAATVDSHKLALSLEATNQYLPARPRKPATAIIEARSVEREADEIARQILELNRTGIKFRNIGVALREPGTYLPLLRATFERFGIPARAYFSTPLRSHPAAIFLNGLIDGALNGWDFELALEALRAHPKWGTRASFDRFDFKVREAMPGRGAEALLNLCEDEPLKAALTECVATEEWTKTLQRPAEWAWRFEHFATTLYRTGTLDEPSDHQSIAIARTHVAARQVWVATVHSITAFWPDAEAAISLEAFWSVAAVALNGAVIRAADDRANIVQIMSVYEARQWDLSALFVCGVLDREFPKRHPQNLLFPDSEIEILHKAGIPVRKAADLANEEGALFDSLKTRATEALVLTYPKQDTGGRSAQPSRYLADLGQPAIPAVPCRPELKNPPETPGLTGSIHAPELLAEMTTLHKSVSLSGLEDLAQCRFKFFGSRTLKLKGAPDRPGERLQARLTGLILHSALELWIANRDQNFVQLFEQTFDETCRQQHIPAGYKLEVERIKFREIAERINTNEKWLPESSEAEVSLALDFPGGVTINCRIDRIDRWGNDCVIIDYKSSKTENVKKLPLSRTKLQGPIYALAVRERMNLNPVAMVFWAVRDDERFGWGHIPGANDEFLPIPANWMEDARDNIVTRLGGYLAGDVQVLPEETEGCRWCDFKGACRIEQQPETITLETITIERVMNA